MSNPATQPPSLPPAEAAACDRLASVLVAAVPLLDRLPIGAVLYLDGRVELPGSPQTPPDAR